VLRYFNESSLRFEQTILLLVVLVLVLGPSRCEYDDEEECEDDLPIY